jgi:hypothetical protein
MSILSKIILQILHRCCFTFVEVEGPDADIGVFLIIYVAIIVNFYGYVVVYYQATAKE